MLSAQRRGTCNAMTSSTLKGRVFVPIKYLADCRIDGASVPRKVSGWAFQIPGWPEFHACVRFGNRFDPYGLCDHWLIDHYETGMSIIEAGNLARKEDAPEVMRKLLDAKGKDCVHKTMRNRGVL